MNQYNHGDNIDGFYISVVRVAVLTTYTIIHASNWLKYHTPSLCVYTGYTYYLS